MIGTHPQTQDRITHELLRLGAADFTREAARVRVRGERFPGVSLAASLDVLEQVERERARRADAARAQETEAYRERRESARWAGAAIFLGTCAVVAALFEPTLRQLW